MSTVAFGAVGEPESMWLDGDVDYWIFGLRHASTLKILVKEHVALHGDRIDARILYPVNRSVSFPVTRAAGSDALAVVSKRLLPRSPLLVLSLPGNGYSDVRCG
jgi:hypothetical protein